MSYLVSVSRNTVKKIGEIKGNLAQETKLEPKDIINQCGPSRVSLIEKIGCSKSRSVEQKAIGKESIENFVTEHKGIDIMAFTDGSVKNRADENLPQTLGYGACSSILIPVGNSENVRASNKHVGILTNNVECEVAGIELALEQINEYAEEVFQERMNAEAFIFCDCLSAIDIVCNQTDVTTRLKKIRNMWKNSTC